MLERRRIRIVYSVGYKALLRFFCEIGAIGIPTALTVHAEGSSSNLATRDKPFGPMLYRVTIHLVQNLLLSSKLKFRFGLARSGQARPKHNFSFNVNGRFEYFEST